MFTSLRFYTQTESFGVSIEPKQTEEQPKQCDREHILEIFFIKFRVVSVFSVCFETVCFGCFASLPKQRVLMFWLNRNKQTTNRNSLIESIHVFWYFSENLGLFRYVLEQFCLFQLFRYRFETPKQAEIFNFW
jgi:hypothetical protein